jgi:single-stranded-DNA-specific exonuclease
MIINKKYSKVKLTQEQTNDFNTFKEEYSLHPLLSKYLAHKNIKEFDYYLNPTIDKLDSPENVADLVKAKILIEEKIKTEPNKILVVADYDTDGITAGSVMYLFFKKVFGIELSIYIPERVEGYGLKKDIIEYALKNGFDFIITVDNGIAAFEAVDYAKENGMTVIITDHHLIQDGKLPNADAVLNSIREDCNYKDKHISGVGMAFNLIRSINLEEALKLLPIIAIGTVADVMPLINENRIYVYNGMRTEVTNKGLKSLMNRLEIKENMTSTDIGFKIAPIINSAGREGFAKKAYDLLVSENDDEIESILDEMMEFNRIRKEEQKKIEEDVLKKRINNDGYSITVVPDEKEYIYNGAIVGIVAAKVVEKFNKPTVIFSIKEIEKDGIKKKIYSGSARSTSWFDFSTLINKLKEEKLLISGGGHKGAAGIAIEFDKLNEFKKVFEQLAIEQFKEEDIEVLELIELPENKRDTNNLLRQIKNIFSKIEPMGEGNRPPLIAYDYGIHKDIKVLGKDEVAKHFQFRTQSDIRTIAFNKTNEKGEIPDISNSLFVSDIIESSFENENGELIKYFEFHLKDFFKKQSF